MKKEFLDYIISIGLSEIMIDTIKEKYQLIITVLGINEIDDIFISETISNQGTREYFSLWVFTSSIACRINTLKGDPTLTLIKLDNSLKIVSFFEWNYDLINPTTNSIIKLLVSDETIISEKGFHLYASGVNCSKLLAINKKYFIPILLSTPK